MQTQNAQLRITLPVQLQGYLRSKADKLGLTLAAYVRNLIINDVKEVDYPIFQASDQVTKSHKQALKDRPHATQIDNVGKFLNDL